MKNVKEMKVGDLIRFGDETGIVLGTHWSTNHPQTQWATTLWCDGTIAEFDTEYHSDSVEIVSEGR